MYVCGSGERKRMLCFSNTRRMAEIAEKIGERLWVLKRTCVNPALDCCAETACIYICRGSRCFEHTIDKTEQLIIPKYSRRATDDPCRTCCHGGCAGVNQAARKIFRASLSLNLSCLSWLSLYSTEIIHLILAPVPFLNGRYCLAVNQLRLRPKLAAMCVKYYRC